MFVKNQKDRLRVVQKKTRRRFFFRLFSRKKFLTPLWRLLYYIGCIIMKNCVMDHGTMCESVIKTGVCSVKPHKK